MATATLSFDLPIGHENVAAWWRRKDAYVLTPMALVHVLAVGPALAWIENANSSNSFHATVTGVILAQSFVLGVWAALGGLGTLSRLGIVSAAFVSGVGSYCAAADVQPADRLESLLVMGLMGALFVAAFTAGLLPLRRMLGWRVDFSAVHYAKLRARRGQASFLDFAALSCGLAVPLTLIRLLSEYSGENPALSDWAWIGGILLLVATTAAPVSYFVLAWRHPAVIGLAAAGCACLAASLHYNLSLWFKEMGFVGGGLNLAALHAGVAATCVATFGVLRLAGLKLLAVG